MKILSSSAELEQGQQRTTGLDRRICWGVYLVGAVSLLVLWFVAGSVMFSYFFGGWIMIGAIVLWLIEESLDY